MLFAYYDERKRKEQGKLANEILMDSVDGFINYKAIDDFIHSYIIEPEFRSIDENLNTLKTLGYYVEIVSNVLMKDVLMDNIFYYLKYETYFDDTVLDNCYKAGRFFDLWKSKHEMIYILLDF